MGLISYNDLITSREDYSLKPLIKWPGGKGRLIKHLAPLVPKHDRYIEPFLGGGALFFSLEPASSEVNDLSEELVNFYAMVKAGNVEFLGLVASLSRLFTLLGCVVANHADASAGDISSKAIGQLVSEGHAINDSAVFDPHFLSIYISNAMATSRRLSTAAHSAMYYSARDEYNSGILGRTDEPFKASLFFIIRELCFGSMFRYNSKKHFNIPYGGFSYDRKDLMAKAESLRAAGLKGFFANTAISCSDFREFLGRLEAAPGDFLFLDPPYDSEFSGYSGNAFGRREHEDLKDILAMSSSKFLLIVESTPFIKDLYKPLNLDLHTLSSLYSYSMRGRNDRTVDYLILKNY